jgi:hypothetical protein
MEVKRSGKLVVEIWRFVWLAVWLSRNLEKLKNMDFFNLEKFWSKIQPPPPPRRQ